MCFRVVSFSADLQAARHAVPVYLVEPSILAVVDHWLHSSSLLVSPPAITCHLIRSGQFVKGQEIWQY